MTTTKTDPIQHNWTTRELQPTNGPQPTASDVNGRLALIEVFDIKPSLVPYLAAAAAELALVAGMPWRFSTDDPAVALLRVIAKASFHQPLATGPHTARLFGEL